MTRSRSLLPTSFSYRIDAFSGPYRSAYWAISCFKLLLIFFLSGFCRIKMLILLAVVLLYGDPPPLLRAGPILRFPLEFQPPLGAIRDPFPKLNSIFSLGEPQGLAPDILLRMMQCPPLDITLRLFLCRKGSRCLSFGGFQIWSWNQQPARCGS